MTQRKTTIIVTDPDKTKRNYTSLKMCCELRDDFSIYYLRGVKLPYLYKGKYYIERIELNKKHEKQSLQQGTRTRNKEKKQ